MFWQKRKFYKRKIQTEAAYEMITQDNHLAQTPPMQEHSQSMRDGAASLSRCSKKSTDGTYAIHVLVSRGNIIARHYNARWFYIFILFS
jgi:hypothetical protein